MTRMSPENVFERSTDVLFQEVNGELVMLHLEGDSYFGLDAIGKRIWDLLDGQRTIQQLGRQLEQEYEVEPDELWNDLSELLEALEMKGLINQVNKSADS